MIDDRLNNKPKSKRRWAKFLLKNSLKKYNDEKKKGGKHASDRI